MVIRQRHASRYAYVLRQNARTNGSKKKSHWRSFVCSVAPTEESAAAILKDGERMQLLSRQLFRDAAHVLPEGLNALTLSRCIGRPNDFINHRRRKRGYRFRGGHAGAHVPPAPPSLLLETMP